MPYFRKFVTEHKWAGITGQFCGLVGSSSWGSRRCCSWWGRKSSSCYFCTPVKAVFVADVSVVPTPIFSMVLGFFSSGVIQALICYILCEKTRSNKCCLHWERKVAKFVMVCNSCGSSFNNLEVAPKKALPPAYPYYRQFYCAKEWLLSCIQKAVLWLQKYLFEVLERFLICQY